MTQIELKGIDYTYSPDTPYRVDALKNVSLKIEEGEFVALLGHTGSGKSTLLQVICGLIKPSAGEVLLDGEDIYAKKYDAKKLRSKVGIVFQYPEYQLFEETVIKDVCFGPKNLGLSNVEAQRRALEALDMVDFPRTLYRQSPFFLSGGQKRKAAIAGILAMDPRILILDEPTAGLDPEGREMILGLMTRLNSEGIGIVLVSHSMDDVAEYAKRVLVMSEGSLVYDGGVREAFSERADALPGIPQVLSFTRSLAGTGIEPAIRVDEALKNILARCRRRDIC